MEYAVQFRVMLHTEDESDAYTKADAIANAMAVVMEQIDAEWAFESMEVYSF